MLKSRLVEGMLDSHALVLPSIVSFSESESVSHQVLIYDCIQMSLLVQLVLLLEEVLDNVWVLHDQADNSCVDKDDHRMLRRVELLALIFADLVEEPACAIDDG